EIIDAANAIPALDAGRGVPAGHPPPAPFTVGAMMNASNFSKLQRIDDQTHVAMPRKPDAVRLKGRLVPIAPASGMAADIQDAGQPLPRLRSRRPIQIRGHIQPWPTLVVQHLDGVIRAPQRARDGG